MTDLQHTSVANIAERVKKQILSFRIKSNITIKVHGGGAKDIRSAEQVERLDDNDLADFCHPPSRSELFCINHATPPSLRSSLNGIKCLEKPIFEANGEESKKRDYLQEIIPTKDILITVNIITTGGGAKAVTDEVSIEENLIEVIGAQIRQEKVKIKNKKPFYFILKTQQILVLSDLDLKNIGLTIAREWAKNPSGEIIIDVKTEWGRASSIIGNRCIEKIESEARKRGILNEHSDGRISIEQSVDETRR